MITVGSNFKVQLNLEAGAKPVYVMALHCTTGIRRLALWHHDVIISGSTFFGLGPLMEMQAVEVSGNTPLGEHFLVFAVQNDPDLLADLSQNCRGHFYTLRLVFLDSSGAVIDGEELMLARRRMVPATIRGGRGIYTCSIGTESIFHRHKNRAPRTYSHAEQIQTRDATDFAFQDMGKSLDTTRAKYRQKSGFG